VSRPSLVVHADWSAGPAGRWLAKAERAGDRWLVHPPRQVRTTGLLPALAQAGGPVVLGVDAPIGIPRAYAAAAGVERFLDWLPALGEGRWGAFFDVCDTKEEISLTRPFYPRTGGGTSREHLTTALGCSWDGLLRRCDQAHGSRRAAAPLFWTLGGQQVGKAAIALWREVLQPARREPGVGLWPFDGSFEELASERRLVVVETYPTELHERVGVRFAAGGKREQDARRGQAPSLRRAAAGLDVELEPAAVATIESGFGRTAGADDGFDAMVGLLGMLDVLREGRAPIPADPAVHAVEGWMFGQARG
jgi:hypothetical protein